MSETIIKVEDLSKQYILGHQIEKGLTFREMATNSVKGFLGKLSSLRASSQISDPAHEEFWALRDVSFEVKQGDRIGIIGRNGAGKSTLLKVLSRITEPTKGRISVKGRVASLLEVGTGFHPELSGRENIYLNGAVLGMGRNEIRKKFDEIVAFAEVEKFLDTPVKRYSSGMYVRLAFAVAAHLEPEILIVDEVLAVGDSQFQKKCLGKMEEVSKGEGRTILFVSHNMGAIRALCNKGILLEKGISKYCGDIEGSIRLYDNHSVNSKHFNKISIPKLKLVIDDITINEKSNNLVKPHESLEIKIDIISENKEAIKDLGLHLKINCQSYSGDLFCARTQDSPETKFIINPGKNSFVCRIPEFNLCSDTYILDVGIDYPMIKMIYYEKNILTFDVAEIQANARSHSTIPVYGRVYLSHCWDTN